MIVSGEAQVKKYQNTVKALLADAQRQLSGITTARLDAEVLLAFALQTDRVSLYAHPDKIVSADQVVDFQSYISRRADNFPVAYLVGTKEFWSTELTVNQYTLIPRPETETVVATALELIATDRVCTVLDLGTGSGAIALAIARERPGWEVFASDISTEALDVARANASRYNVNNVKFRQSYWLDKFEHEVFDMVICNPPYVDSRDGGFSAGEIRHEPRIALDGGYQGMQIINHIIPAACKHLRQNGCLLVEHGFGQGVKIRDLLVANRFVDIETRLDYAGLERVSYGCYP